MYHMSGVLCQVSGVTCQVSHVRSFFLFFIIFFLQSGEASRWRGCYQRGLPRLFYFSVASNTDSATARWPQSEHLPLKQRTVSTEQGLPYPGTQHRTQVIVQGIFKLIPPNFFKYMIPFQLACIYLCIGGYKGILDILESLTVIYHQVSRWPLTSQPNLPVILQGSGAWLAAIGNGAWPDMMAGDKCRVTVQGLVQVVLYIKTLLYWQNTIMNFTFI